MKNPDFLLVPFVVGLLICFLVGRAAASFHRSPTTWFFLALLLSPLIAFVLLLLAGDPRKALALRDKEERLRHQHPGRTDLGEAALNEMNCPHCGAAVNPVTGDGLHSVEKTPWLLLRNECQGTIEPEV